MKFYTYCLIDPRNDQLFYIGKGSDDRAYVHEKEALRGTKITNIIKHNKILNIIESGFNVKVKILDHFTDEQEAYNKEQYLISLHGRLFNGSGILTNISSGGSTYIKESLPVKQYTFFGDYIQTFKSTKEAADAMGIRYSSSLANAVIGRVPSYKGYLWCYVGSEPIIPKTIIYCWSKTGELIEKYKNQGDASRAIGCAQAQLHNHLKHGGTCKGYMLSYSNTFPTIQDNRFKVWDLGLRNKKVVHLNTGIVYDTVTKAAEATNHNIGSVSKICKGKRQHICGDGFKYY